MEVVTDGDLVALPLGMGPVPSVSGTVKKKKINK
jgi:hypothetical protein